MGEPENTYVRLSPEQIEQLRVYYSAVCGEEVLAEVGNFQLYIFGSELACLRLYYKYVGGRVKWVESRASWFYARALVARVAGEWPCLIPQTRMG